MCCSVGCNCFPAIIICSGSIYFEFILIISVYIGSIPTLLMLNAIGNKLLHGDYLNVALLGGALVLGVTLLYVFRKRIFALADQFHAWRETHKNQSANT